MPQDFVKNVEGSLTISTFISDSYWIFTTTKTQHFTPQLEKRKKGRREIAKAQDKAKKNAKVTKQSKMKQKENISV